VLQNSRFLLYFCRCRISTFDKKYPKWFETIWILNIESIFRKFFGNNWQKMAKIVIFRHKIWQYTISFWYHLIYLFGKVAMFKWKSDIPQKFGYLFKKLLQKVHFLYENCQKLHFRIHRLPSSSVLKIPMSIFIFYITMQCPVHLL
jgi:hypothetical protein